MPVMILFLPLFLHSLLLLSSSTSESECVSVVTASNVRTPKADMRTEIIYHSYDKRYKNSINCQLLNFCGGLVAEKVSSVPSVQASLRMPVKATTKERKARVDQAILEMGLVSCLDPKIGCKHEKSISCGEKKRLSFACEILTDPPILFCDEPTSGLDSFMALQVMKALSTLAREGKTVVCSIHQPSSQVFEMADKLVLLVLGQIAYQGPIKEVDAFFRNCDMPLPKCISVPDNFVKVLSRNAHTESEEEYMTRTKRVFSNYKSCGYADAVHNETHRLETSSTRARMRLAGNNKNYAAPWHSQFFWLFWRGLKVVLREPMIVQVRLVQCVLVSIVLGILYSHLPMNFLIILLLGLLPLCQGIICHIGYVDNSTRSSLTEVAFKSPVGCSVEYSRYNLTFTVSHVFFENCVKPEKVTICGCNTDKCTTDSKFLETLLVSKKVRRMVQKLIIRLELESDPFAATNFAWYLALPLSIAISTTIFFDFLLVCCWKDGNKTMKCIGVIVECPIVAGVVLGTTSITLFGLLCNADNYLRKCLTVSAFLVLFLSVVCVLYIQLISAECAKMESNERWGFCIGVIAILLTCAGCILCAIAPFNDILGDFGNTANAIAATAAAIVAYLTLIAAFRRTISNLSFVKRRSSILATVVEDKTAQEEQEMTILETQKRSPKAGQTAQSLSIPAHQTIGSTTRRFSAPAALPLPAPMKRRLSAPGALPLPTPTPVAADLSNVSNSSFPSIKK